MSEEPAVEQKTPEELDAAWREQLPPEFRPVAERYGRELFLFGFNTWVFAQAQVRSGQIGQHMLKLMADSSVALRKQASGFHPVLQQDWMARGQAVEYLAQQLAELKGWEGSKVQEVQRDLTAAAQLAAAGKEAGKLVLVH